MKLRVISLVHLVTIVISIGDALGQQYEARQGGPEGDLTDEGYSLSSRRRDNDFSKSRRTYDTDFDAVRGAFQDTGETLRDQQSASGSGGRLNTVGRRQQHDCDNNDIAECVGLLEVLTNKDLGFAASVDELNNMCPVLLNGLQCIDNYTRRCLSLKHREYFNKLYAGTIRVIKDLCNTKGKYQLEYIRHAPCMRQVNPKYNGCSEAYHKKTADLNQINDAVVQLSDEEKNKNVITLCCSFQEYLQCSEQVVFETCGNETALFTKEFLDRMAGPIVQDLCQAFYFSLHSCSQESSTSAQKTVVDSDKEVFHDPSTLSSGSDSVDPHSSVQSMLPHSDSSLVSVSLSPRRETFIETTTNELLTVPSDNASVHGEVDFVREVRPHSHTTPVSVEVEAVSEKTEEATDSMVQSPSITNKITHTKIYGDHRQTLHDLENEEVSNARFSTTNPAAIPWTSVRDAEEHENMNHKIHAVTDSSHTYENLHKTSTEIGHTDSPVLTVPLSSVTSSFFLTEDNNFDILRNTLPTFHNISPKLLQDVSVLHTEKKRETDGEYSALDSTKEVRDYMDPASVPLVHSSVPFHKRRVRPGSIRNKNFTHVGDRDKKHRPYRRRLDNGTHRPYRRRLDNGAVDTVGDERPLRRRSRPNLRRRIGIARNGTSIASALSDHQQVSELEDQKHTSGIQEEEEQENKFDPINNSDHNKTEIITPPIFSHVNIAAIEPKRNSTINNIKGYSNSQKRRPYGFQRGLQERRKKQRERLGYNGHIPPSVGSRMRPRKPRIHGRPIGRKPIIQHTPIFATDRNHKRIPVWPKYGVNRTTSARNFTDDEEISHDPEPSLRSQQTRLGSNPEAIFPNNISKSVFEDADLYGLEQNTTITETGNSSMNAIEIGGMSSSEDSVSEIYAVRNNFVPFGLNDSVNYDHDFNAFKNESTLELLESKENISESDFKGLLHLGSIVDTNKITSAKKDKFNVTASPIETFYWWFQSRVLNEVQEAVIPVPTPAPFTTRLLQEMTNKEIPAANFPAVTLDILDSDFVPLLMPQEEDFENFPKGENFVVLEEALLSHGKHHLNTTKTKSNESFAAHDGKTNTSDREIIPVNTYLSKEFYLKNETVNTTDTHSPAITENTQELSTTDVTALYGDKVIHPSENGMNSTALMINITDGNYFGVNPANSSLNGSRSLSDGNESRSAKESWQSTRGSLDNLIFTTLAPLEGSGDEMLLNDLQNSSTNEKDFSEYTENLQSQNCSRKLSCDLFKCLNYAPGSQDCSAGSASVWPSHMSLTLLVTTLLFFRWFVA